MVPNLKVEGQKKIKEYIRVPDVLQVRRIYKSSYENL
jgi:hypothetical protein